MLKTIRCWWIGAWVHPDNPPGTSVIFLGHQERHWTSEWAHNSLEYVRQRHQWIISTALTAIGLLIAVHLIGAGRS